MAVPLKVCSQHVLELSWALSLFLWNVDIHSSLFTIKSCTSANGFQKIVPFSHGTWLRAVVYAQFKAVFVSVSLFPGCAVEDIDRCEVVKIPAIFQS